jgi:glycosyltransferase involved in cell wall biosynthesis
MAESMRVLLVAGSYPPMRCGVGDYIAQLASALAQQPGVEIAVLTDERMRLERGTSGDPRVTLVPGVNGWRPRDLMQVVRSARAWRPDVVHLQYPALGFGSRIVPCLLHTAFRAIGMPVVETWHEYYPSGAWRVALHAGFAGDVIVVRPGYESRIPGWYRFLLRRKRFHFVANASAIPQARLTEADRDAVRAAYVPDGGRLVVYFGFLYPAKGVEQLFEIADPARDRLVIIGQVTPGDPYHARILEQAASERWRGRVTMAGFLSPDAAARVLAAADAVVLPFRTGGGIWNTSLHGATAQGVFVVTTSLERTGYDPAQHVYHARPDDVADMHRALARRLGERREVPPRTPADEWRAIADAHCRVYAGGATRAIAAPPASRETSAQTGSL